MALVTLLLKYLSQLSEKEREAYKLHAFVVNHGARQESEEEALRVKKLLRIMGALPFHCRIR